MSIRLLSLYRRSVAALVLLIMLLALGFFVQSVQADFPVPGYEEERREYYSDASKTNLVGGWWFDCYGEIHTWGERTGYVTYLRTRC